MFQVSGKREADHREENKLPQIQEVDEVKCEL